MSSLRGQFPRAHLPKSHVFLTLAHGENLKTWAVRPFLLYCALAAGPVLGVLGLGGAGWVAMHPGLMPGLQSSSAASSTSAARLQELSAELTEAQSRALVARSALEGKVKELLTRQAQVEARQAIVATLAEVALPASSREASQQAKAAPPAAAANNPLLAGTGTFGTQKAVPGFPDAISSYLPTARPMPLPETDSDGNAPKPLGAQSSLDAAKGVQVAGFEPIASEINPFQALDRTAARLELNESRQIVALDAIGAAADKTIARQKLALTNAGLNLDNLSAPGAGGVGGPFVPMKVNPHGNEFERAVYRAQTIIETAAHLKRIMPYVPLRRPLAAGAEITSGFGGRVDPFNGQMAMHTGVDFRLEYGAPVHPTASGVVITAENNGGYGNMVDVDHGNGLTTRYGHMSAILVKPGDHVTPSSILGRLGSTGRSTGPHLHYEVRVNDEAVNPMRFLKAGEPIFAAN